MGVSHKDLIVWQRAIQMSVAIYKLTAGFPREELYGLTAQLRRAGVSVASNIAEGYGRMSTGEYKHFLGMRADQTWKFRPNYKSPQSLVLVIPINCNQQTSNQMKSVKC